MHERGGSKEKAYVTGLEAANLVIERLSYVVDAELVTCLSKRPTLIKIKNKDGRLGKHQNKNGENLRKYRGHKIKKGRRAIKTKRYPYSQGDLVRFEGRVFEVIGMQNKGKGVKIANYPGIKNKVVNPSKVSPVQKREGICYVA